MTVLPKQQTGALKINQKYKSLDNNHIYLKKRGNKE